MNAGEKFPTSLGLGLSRMCVKGGHALQQLQGWAVTRISSTRRAVMASALGVDNPCSGFPNRRLTMILADERIPGIEDADCHGIRGLFQPTIQPTNYDVLYDFRVFWQSPRSCKLL